MKRVHVYFVASPLQLMVAEQLAHTREPGVRQVLIWYRPEVAPCVRKPDWDACSYMPWPRFNPLPGPFGLLRRLRENIALVAGLVGPCDALVLHSAVFDTEAINYFLRALPAHCGARTTTARLLPDGVSSLVRRPLSRTRVLGQ